MSNENDAKQEVDSSTTPLAEAIASTPEVQQEAQEQAQETQGTETGTPQQPASQEQNVPFNEHPRFREVIEERNYWRDKALEQRQQPPQLQQPTQLPEEIGSTPEEREFWRLQRRIAREEAEKVQRQVNPMLEAGIRELTNMKVQQFRQTHPDIKPDSPEEIQIAQKINMGYLPDDAYRSVMWDKKVAEAENKGNVNQKQKIETKKQANVEQRSIPQGAIPPTKEKLTLRQRIEREASNLEF